MAVFKPENRRTLRITMSTIGAILILLALYLAVAHHYKHFFEMLASGMVIMLGGILGNSFSLRTYLVCFSVFASLGLFGDLLFGLSVVKAWYYNFNYGWEYL